MNIFNKNKLILNMAKHLKIKINSLEFNGETILKNIDFTLNKNDRISIV